MAPALFIGNLSSGCLLFAKAVVAVLVAGCAAYGPYYADTDEPFNSVRGPEDGRYKLAFIEFGDQGSMQDPSQLAAALQVIGKAERPCSSFTSTAGKTTRIRGTSAGSNTSSIRCRAFQR